MSALHVAGTEIKEAAKRRGTMVTNLADQLRTLIQIRNTQNRVVQCTVSLEKEALRYRKKALVVHRIQDTDYSLRVDWRQDRTESARERPIIPLLCATLFGSKGQ